MATNVITTATGSVSFECFKCGKLTKVSKEARHKVWRFDSEEVSDSETRTYKCSHCDAENDIQLSNNTWNGLA
jgi:DNA-directed RNA polymerase subunit RPC12/RpoP